MPSGSRSTTSTPIRKRTASDTAAPRSRARYIVDVAVDYARTQRAHGWTAKEIARRRGRSPGYGSMVLRVGQAVVDLSSAELALFRTPRVTLLEISRRLRRDMDVPAIRRMLLSLATTPTPDGRRARGGRPTAPSLRPPARRRGTHVWRWDETAAAHDPAGAITAWLDHVRATERELALGLRELLAGRQTEAARILAAHGMRGLAAALKRGQDAGQASAEVVREAATAPGSNGESSAAASVSSGGTRPARTPRIPSSEARSRDAVRVLDALRALDSVMAELSRIERLLGGGVPTARATDQHRTTAPGTGAVWTEPDLAMAIEEDLAP